jgi:phosphate uptake regulator
MFDQMFENLRRMSESALQMQQDMLRQWTSQWPTMPFGGGSPEATRDFQKRWQEFATETLRKHSEALDATYKSGIQLIEQSFRVSDTDSPEEQRRMVEELWSQLFRSMKEQSESQSRELQKAMELWFRALQRSGS